MCCGFCNRPDIKDTNNPGILTLNAPITTKVVCFSRLLKCLKRLYGKQCGPRSDCSYRSSLFWVHAVASILNSSVTGLATDACLTADPGVASLIPARSHTFVEIDHEIISTVILLPSADSFKKGCCQLQAKVCAQITG